MSTLATALLECLEFESGPVRITEYQPPAHYLTHGENTQYESYTIVLSIHSNVARSF
jgi:hypothetical protein